MTYLQALLGLFLLTGAPSSGATYLREGNPAAAAAVPTPPQRRRANVLLEVDEVAFLVQYAAVTEGQIRPASQTELDNFKASTDGTVIAAVNLADALPQNQDTTVNVCASRMASAAWSPVTNTHTMVIRYTCDFEDHRAPTDVTAWVASVEGESDMDDMDADFTVGAARTVGDSDDIFANTTSLVVSGFSPTGSTARLQRFNNSFVLPYGITWSFTTPAVLANQTDLDAVRSATEDWITNYWDEVYGFEGGFARQNVQVRLRLTSFSPNAALYQQQVSLGIEVLVGANNITDIPSVQTYATTMQLLYPVSNFTEILDTYLDEGSVLGESTQTTFAVTPTFNVATLSDSTSRLDNKRDEIVLSSIISLAVVLDADSVP